MKLTISRIAWLGWLTLVPSMLWSQMLPYPAPYQPAGPMMPYAAGPMWPVAAPAVPAVVPAGHEQAAQGKADGKKGGPCYRWIAFGELLYLRARDADVAYGVPIDGPITSPPTNNPIQIGRVGVVDQDYDPGFRVGLGYALDDGARILAQYTFFETQRQDAIGTSAPDVIRSLVSHPGTSSAATDFLSASARHDLSIDMIDIDYRFILDAYDNYELAMVLGARYGQMEQLFQANFVNSGTETVDSDVDFFGAGARLGLEGELAMRGRWFTYGKGAVSLLAGEFKTAYRQSQSFDPTVVDTTWEAGRIVPVLDLELGLGWGSKCGTWRLSVGYLYSAWTNMVKTDEFIQAVQRNDFVDMSGTITFDGLVGRVEGRF